MTDTLGQTADDLAEVEYAQAEITAASVAEAASRQAVATSLADQPALDRKWMRGYAMLLLLADGGAGLVAAAAAYLARPWVSPAVSRLGYMGERMDFLTMAAISLAVWLGMLGLSGAYRSRHVTSDGRDYRVPVKSAVRLLAACAIGTYLFHATLSRTLMLTFFAALVVSVVALRALVNLLLRQARKQGRARSRVLLVGEGRTVRAFADHLLSRSDDRADIVAVCANERAEKLHVRGRDLPVVGSPDDVVDAAYRAQADTVVFAGPTGLKEMTLQQVAWRLERSRIDLLVAPDTVALAGPRLKVSSLRGLPLLQVEHPQHESALRTLHFHFSRLVGALLLAVISPVFLAVALAIKLGSPGPVFYRQKRIGYKGQEFDMLKFRSMVPDAESLLPELLDLNEHDGALFKMKDDPRITRVGKFLRKYSLDEIPQLMNVVKGDMTLVGPRPCLAREMTMFGEAEHRRFMVRPGMTGLWQVSGGPSLPWSDAVKTDLYYVDNWSPALDASILARTVRVVLAGSGY